jgi:Flp pilus assembly protein TadG
VRRRRGDRGAGLIGTIGGVVVFLALLTFAVQLLFNLYATSAVTAVAHDAARTAAAGAGDPGALEDTIADAEVAARAALGEYGGRLKFTWDVDARRVRLTIEAQHPRVALSNVSSVFGLNRVERTVEVRVEDVR